MARGSAGLPDLSVSYSSQCVYFQSEPETDDFHTLERGHALTISRISSMLTSSWRHVGRSIIRKTRVSPKNLT